MDENEKRELLRKARTKIAKLRPRARKLGVVDETGRIEAVHDESGRVDVSRAGRVLPFPAASDKRTEHD
jgi:hypothetical protein